MTIDALGGGSGELGSSSARVSGAPFGFYVQLAMASRLFNIEQGKSIEEYANAGADAQLSGFDAAAILAGGGTAYAFLGMSAPGMAITNSFSPAALGNAAQNVRIGSEINGIDRGYLMDAQGLNLIKAPLTSAGSAMVAAATPTALGGEPWSIAAVIAGSLMTALGNSIQVNPITGERKSQLTQAGQLQTAVSIATAAIGGAYAKSATNVLGVQVTAAQGANAASSFITGGVRTDSSGNVIGYGFGGKEGRARLLRTTAGVVTSVGIGKLPGFEGVGPFAQTVGSSALNRASAVATEYLIQQTLGQQFSGFQAMQRPGLEGFSSLLAGAVSNFVNQKIAERKQEQFEQSYVDSLIQDGMSPYEALSVLYGGAVLAARRREEDLQYGGEGEYVPGQEASGDEFIAGGVAANNENVIQDWEGNTLGMKFNTGTVGRASAYTLLKALAGSTKGAEYAAVQTEMLTLNNVSSMAELQAKINSGDMIHFPESSPWNKFTQGHYSYHKNLRDQAAAGPGNQQIFKTPGGNKDFSTVMADYEKFRETHKYERYASVYAPTAAGMTTRRSEGIRLFGEELFNKLEKGFAEAKAKSRSWNKFKEGMRSGLANSLAGTTALLAGGVSLVQFLGQQVPFGAVGTSGDSLSGLYRDNARAMGVDQMNYWIRQNESSANHTFMREALAQYGHNPGAALGYFQGAQGTRRLGSFSSEAATFAVETVATAGLGTLGVAGYRSARVAARAGSMFGLSAARRAGVFFQHAGRTARAAFLGRHAAARAFSADVYAGRGYDVPRQSTFGAPAHSLDELEAWMHSQFNAVPQEVVKGLEQFKLAGGRFYAARPTLIATLRMKSNGGRAVEGTLPDFAGGLFNRRGSGVPYIVIDSTASRAHQVEKLVHEVTHFVNKDTGVIELELFGLAANSPDLRGIRRLADEYFATRTAQQFARDNRLYLRGSRHEQLADLNESRLIDFIYDEYKQRYNLPNTIGDEQRSAIARMWVKMRGTSWGLE